MSSDLNILKKHDAGSWSEELTGFQQFINTRSRVLCPQHYLILRAGEDR
jgi:hypothetical protein